MDMRNVVIYEPDLGLDGTIPELVNWAERYTNDYSDPALERISELARQYGLDQKYIEIPLLLRNERLKEGNGTLESAYARLQIEHWLGDRISLSMSNYGTTGTELEIREEDEKILISLTGADSEGAWTAANAYHIDEFMPGPVNNLDIMIGNTLAYGKVYEEVTE